MVAILFLADDPKSIASVFMVVWYHISNLKSIGETVLKISLSQVRQTEGRNDRQTTSISMSYPNFVCRGQWNWYHGIVTVYKNTCLILGNFRKPSSIRISHRKSADVFAIFGGSHTTHVYCQSRYKQLLIEQINIL